MMRAIRSFPRATFTAYVKALRLPLSAAERVAGQRNNDSWPPSLAYERLEARLETVAGALLRDDALIDAGEQRDARVVKLKEASALKRAAEVEKTHARQEQRRRDTEIAKQNERAKRAAREGKEAVQAKAAEEKESAEATAARREAAAHEKEAAQQKVIDRNKRAAKGEALRSESEALDLTDEALKAQETVDLIDSTIEGAKEARQTR